MHRLSATPFLFALAICAAPASVTTAQDILQKQSQQAWESIWQRFYHPDSQTFMDYLSSYEAGHELAHLPTVTEVKRQFPNPCGYGSGMEDGMILGGAMLSVVCDRYAVTKEASLGEKAEMIFAGMRRCATVHGKPGFVARNVCPGDQTSIYINSSRDQVTHFVHGLWRYFHSPLPDASTKQAIGNLLAAVADRMTEFVVPENDFDFCRADGSRCPLGICRMWNVNVHEAARLPMIYAAAWDTTGEERFREQWQRYVNEAIQQSAGPLKHQPAYALLQMQCSLEVLHDVETDAARKAKIVSIMNRVGQMGRTKQTESLAKIRSMDDQTLTMLGPDWRHAEKWIHQGGYPNPQWGPYREVWHTIRETGESALIAMMVPHASISDDQQADLHRLLQRLNYDRCSSCGIVYHLAAHWKAKRLVSQQ
ncbi:hypothetical protein [Roseiconus lacunae]|uniref:hypothetical protein n=1 Tax=Roseiconus lacunae TaxID=2605694 RepID=UPI001F2DFBB2|nr:hypothetical protein [Roseiconus lacunae]